MDNLPKNLAELRECISRIKPWAAVAGVCAALLLGFYSLQGMQYWQAWNNTKTMTKDLERISLKLERGVPSAEEVTRDLETRQQRLEYLNSLFAYPDTARLMGMVSAISWDTGVDLPSISAGDPTIRKEDGIEYRTQVLSLTARGSIPDIYRFLATVHDRIKVVSVPNISIANPSSLEATAQVQLLFYLSPKPITEKDGAN